MNLKSRQRGALIIVAIVLLVVTAVLATVLSYLSAATNTAGAYHNQSAQALAIAQAGLERASYQLGLAATHTGTGGTECGTAGLVNTNVVVGNGSFTTTSQLYQNTAGQALSAALTISATSIPLNTAGFAPHGRVRIDNEEINYSGLTATALTGATRGSAGTTAAAHLSGALVKQDLCLIRSTGTVGNAKRIVEGALHDQDAMMVYAKTNAGAGCVAISTPCYRVWSGAAWGAEAFGLSALSAVQYMIIKFSRTRNEAVMGLTDANGRTTVQVWDGFTWGNQVTLATGTVNVRNFDIAYETKTDRAIVVFSDTSVAATNRNPRYKIWNGVGGGWSGTVSLATDLGANYPATGNFPPNWIILASNPLIASNEIAMITLNSNQEVTGARWNGTQWVSMPPVGLATWDTAIGTGTLRAIDVAYEQLTGNAVFAWASAAATNPAHYRIWNGAAISGANLNITMSGTRIEWARLAARPDSNQLMFAAADTAQNLSTAFWNGAAWAARVSQGTTQQRNNRTFDIAWETYPSPSNVGSAWLVWGNNTAAPNSVSRRQWTGGAWSVTTSTTAGSDATNLVNLLSHPSTGNVFAAVYESSAAANPEELLGMQLTGGSATWSATTQLFTRNTATTDLQGRAALGARGVIPIDWQEIFP